MDILLEFQLSRSRYGNARSTNVKGWLGGPNRELAFPAVTSRNLGEYYLQSSAAKQASGIR